MTDSVRNPHAVDPIALAEALGVDSRRGLTETAVAERRAEAGLNELAARKTTSLPGLIWAAVSQPFIVLLLVAGALAVILGEVRDGVLVMLGLLPIVIADVVTEYRADRALEALREASAPRARVLRDGQAVDLPAAELVVGDVVLVHSGDVVPADLRLVEVNGLLVDRSTLTGESLPEPAAVVADDVDAPVADRRSMAYSGTAVVGGRGRGLVVAIGAGTELGVIASGLGTERRHRSPLQLELDRLVRILLAAAAALIVITVGLGFARGNPLGANLLAGISAAIAAVPEEPPILLAVVLGLGAFRLLKRGVLVRRLSAQETLGAVDLILTDKTGTLTENRLRLVEVADPDGPMTGPLRRSARLDALRAEEDAWQAVGTARTNAFTRALLEAMENDGDATRLDPADLLVAAAPSDDRPYASATVADPDGQLELALGAVEAILALDPDLNSTELERWQAAVVGHAADGGRVLLLARRRLPDGWAPAAILVFADPLRPAVAEAMALARGAGIQTLIVTGDHPRTAAAVARAAELKDVRVVTGSEIAEWDDDRLTSELASLDVVARAVPAQKLRLVEAAHRAGRTVVVTGDGVNDAPALHGADVGVAMGSGTQVAREAADLVLGDDSFATLLYGLREGRRMVDNVLKGLVFLLSTHVALLGFILLATLVGFSQPLIPLQILWMELFIDLTASIAMEREAEEPGTMTRPPRPRGAPLLTRPLLIRLGAAGTVTAVAALAVMEFHPGDAEHARWLAYTALAVGQAVRAYANRSLRQSIFALRPNRFLALAVVAVVAFQLAIPALPVLAEAFHASVLSAAEWGIVALIAVAPAVVAELVRRITGRDWVA